MKDWVAENTFSSELKVEVPMSTPLDGLWATRIEKKDTVVSIDELSVVEEYAMAQWYFLSHFQFYLNYEGSQGVTEHLSRLLSVMKRGKVWLRNEVPVALNIKEMAESIAQHYKTKFEQGAASPIIKSLFLKQEHEEDVSEKMKRYRVKKECVTPLEIHPDLCRICDFIRSTSFPQQVTTLQASGWYLTDMDKPNEVISMLFSRFQEVNLIVYPSSNRIRFIEAIE